MCTPAFFIDIPLKPKVKGLGLFCFVRSFPTQHPAPSHMLSPFFHSPLSNQRTPCTKAREETPKGDQQPDIARRMHPKPRQRTRGPYRAKCKMHNDEHDKRRCDGLDPHPRQALSLSLSHHHHRRHQTSDGSYGGARRIQTPPAARGDKHRARGEG